MTHGLNESTLRTRLETILREEQKRDRQSRKRCIGIRSDAWVGPDEVRAGGEAFRVVFCTSPLAVREQLAALPAEGTPRLVIVTSCDETQLGADVQARVLRNRFQPIDRWQLIREKFQCRQLGPGVPKEPWLAEELLATTEDDRTAPTAGDVLDLETVRTAVFRRLGLSGRPDLQELVAWAAEGGSLLARKPLELQPLIRAWMEESAGSAGGILLDSLAAGHGAVALPLGLVLRVLIDDQRPEAVAALARVERFLGHRRFRPDELRPWAGAAEQVLRNQLRPEHAKDYEPVLAEAERLVQEVDAGRLAHRSQFLKSGLRAREQRFAEEVGQALDRGSRDLGGVEQAARAVVEHELAAIERGRAIRSAVEMTGRLLRWLGRDGGTGGAVPQTFRDAALAYAREGSFVDYAREMTTLGYPHTELQIELRRLWSTVRERRERENRRFGELCADWCKAPTATADLVPLQQVLDGVVGPLLEHSKVLLLVFDGMSLPVFHELAADMGRFGWLELGPAAEGEVGQRRFGVAVLPTVTEVSRTSLLTGKVQLGNQDTERVEFESHPRLRHKNKPARLLHKDRLTGDRVGLDPDVASVVTTGPPLVGIVINAIDDWLGKGDQNAAPWSVENIRPLNGLLDLAAQSGRVLVITSDHGHVREHDSRFVEGKGGARYRPPGPLGEGELLVEGPQVCAPGGSVVVPWTESLRYAAPKQNGYHGGITPQEVLVPLAVFARAGGEELEGYAETPPGLPAWWEEAPAVATPARPPRKTTAAKARPGTKQQTELAFSGGKRAWIQALLASPVFAVQREQAQRVYPGDDKTMAVLQVFADKGDTMTVLALANHLNLPASRVQGMLTGLRRVLNVDGTEALEVVVQSGTVHVHWEILRLQFGLDAEGRS